tara:strand:+ start:11471 stop:11998 length:528 start_codon:yes stop_codon:yes gene_type:complete
MGDVQTVKHPVVVFVSTHKQAPLIAEAAAMDASAIKHAKAESVLASKAPLFAAVYVSTPNPTKLIVEVVRPPVPPMKFVKVENVSKTNAPTIQTKRSRVFVAVEKKTLLLKPPTMTTTVSQTASTHIQKLPAPALCSVTYNKPTHNPRPLVYYNPRILTASIQVFSTPKVQSNMS